MLTCKIPFLCRTSDKFRLNSIFKNPLVAQKTRVNIHRHLMTIPVCIPSADSGFVQLCSAGSGWNSDPTAHLAASSGSMFSQPSVSGKTSSFTVFWRENEDCSFNFKKTNKHFFLFYVNKSYVAGAPKQSSHGAFCSVLGSFDPCSQWGVACHQAELLPLGQHQCGAHLSRPAEHLQNLCKHHCSRWRHEHRKMTEMNQSKPGFLKRYQMLF